MKWAAAAYGNMLGYLKMRKKFLQYWIGAEGAQLQKIAPLRGDRAVVHDHLQLSDDDFVTGCWAYAELGHMPGYFIGIDHSTKNVVLSLRGSSNHNDALTDLAGKYVPFLDGMCVRERERERARVFDSLSVLSSLIPWSSYYE